MAYCHSESLSRAGAGVNTPPHIAAALSQIGVVVPVPKPVVAIYPPPWKPTKPGDDPPF